MAVNVSSEKIASIGAVLNDVKCPMADRFRALFTLRNIANRQSIDQISAALLNDDSILLKHECAYCLGQIKDVYSNDVLIKVLSNTSEHPIVRHEAGEALGAIGSQEAIDVLKKFVNDESQDVRETCQLALCRIEWESKGDKTEEFNKNHFKSIDPAPPLETKLDVQKLEEILIDSSKDIFSRYRAMFTLRDINTDESALALAEGLKCSDSALLRHEIAFVLGQMQNSVVVEQLNKTLQDNNENEMVRHECVEALGAIANDEANAILKQYIKHNRRLIRESVEVALDISDYNNSDQFQYANSL